MAEPFDVEGHHILIGASVGIAVAPVDGTDGDILVKNADLALYRAKHDGRGTYHFYERGLDAALQERRSMESALRSALPGNEFRLLFPAAAQPRGQPHQFLRGVAALGASRARFHASRPSSFRSPRRPG